MRSRFGVWSFGRLLLLAAALGGTFLLFFGVALRVALRARVVQVPPLVGKTVNDASQTLGASRIRTFFRIILPLSLSGLVTGIALSFAHTMGEFGVVLMVGGNIPGVTRTVSIDIYDKVQAVNYSGANATALVLLAISFFTLAIVYGLNRRVWIWKGVQ